MKSKIRRDATPKTSRRTASAPPPPARTAEHKDWTVKVQVRLPHKIGQPLGCDSSSDGGCGD